MKLKICETDETRYMKVLDLQNGNRQLHTDEVRRCTFSAALGCFDGVHIGHAALLRAACDAAAKNGSAPAVWTFAAPPFPNRAKQLTTLTEKLSLFAGYGIRYAILFDFADVRDLSPDDFIHRILIGQSRIVSCVCGFNFRFGKDAAGTSAHLVSGFEGYGYSVSVQPAVSLDGSTVSSTRIRSLLSVGDTMTAAHCLGRWHSLTLPVVHGKELGRTIGVPTLNQNPPSEMQIPANGTYASFVSVDGKTYPAVTNIGMRPTVDRNVQIPNAETHIIGYSGTLYDRDVTVAFRRRLRDEIRFDSLEALRTQITRDIAASAESFSGDQSEFSF